jgi:transglutaminase-like putative cysteine protease
MPDQTIPGTPGVEAAQPLQLTVGCRFGLQATQPTTAIMQVAPHAQPGLTIAAECWASGIEHHGYADSHGNRCERFALGAGSWSISYEAQVAVASPADTIEPNALETPVGLLPDHVLGYVMPSRFCLPDELGHEWQRFGSLPPGWGRVQSIVDYVHGHLEFMPGGSNPWTSAADAYRAGQGVCRDFAHLAITFCRALNIPARYVFGYIPDIGNPPGAVEQMDFAAWFEAYLDGRWYTFDARNNRPRIGRVIVGRGRDAVDVALITSFGPLTLTDFEVRAERREQARAA